LSLAYCNPWFCRTLNSLQQYAVKAILEYPLEKLQMGEKKAYLCDANNVFIDSDIPLQLTRRKWEENSKDIFR
jgi:hypothetical protein